MSRSHLPRRGARRRGLSLAFLLLSAAVPLAPLSRAAFADPPPPAAPAPAKPPNAASDKADATDRTPKLSRKEIKELTAKLPKKYREWLYVVDPLITDDEKSAFLMLVKDYQRDAFIKRFWEVRNPHAYGAGGRNTFRDNWEARLDEARERFGSIEDVRSRMLLLNGPPAFEMKSACHTLLWPLEIWYYNGSDRLGGEFFMVFYQYAGVGLWRLFEPQDGIEALFADVSAATAGGGGRNLGAIYNNCRDGEKLAGAIGWVINQGLHYAQLQSTFQARPKAPQSEWVASFRSYTTELPEGAVPLPAKLDLDFPGRDQNRTVLQGVLGVPADGAVQAKLGERRSYDFSLTGEVLHDGELFDNFRYKFDIPATDAAAQPGGTLPLVFLRTLRPGEYTMILRLEDLNGHRFFRAERSLSVPEVDKPTAYVPTTPEEVESARLLAEANAAIANGETTVKIVEPHGDLMTGMVRFDAMTTGTTIDKVTFALDGRPVLTKRKPPFSVELDLGSLPRPRNLTATAYNAAGQQVADDRLVINASGHRFRVKLVEPQRSKHYTSSLLARAQVDLPEDGTIDRVEFFVNETRIATLYQPPFQQPIVLPKDQSLAYVRAVAYLVDGNSTEDLVFVNAPDVEQVNVQFVELYTAVFDKRGRPVPNLQKKDFTVLEDGVRQEIARFDKVTDLPIHAAIVLDTSASMEPALDKARDAALQFLQETIKPKDRATVITFNDHPDLTVKFTNDQQALAGGLAALKAERGTALYDTVVFTLFNFNGVKGQRAVLILSDGRDENSRVSFEDPLDYARRAGVTIYAIG
ncbi:MAG TPA: VWA domain-containing protein, partial [Thermoanaerobaculia bacterium]